MTQIIALALPFVAKKSEPVLAGFALKTLRFLFVIFLLSLFVASVWQINEYSGAIFSIQTYKKNLDSVSRENRFLEISFTQLNSLEKLNIQPSGFEKSANTDYIRISEKRVVTKAK